MILENVQMSVTWNDNALFPSSMESNMKDIKVISLIKIFTKCLFYTKFGRIQNFKRIQTPTIYISGRGENKNKII